MEEKKDHPLIVVFYLDRELMQNKDIMIHFSQYVDNMITEKKANMMAFFIPTDGEERVECINPVVLKENEMDKVNVVLADLKKNFDIEMNNTNNKDE